MKKLTEQKFVAAATKRMGKCIYTGKKPRRATVFVDMNGIGWTADELVAMGRASRR